MRLAKLVSSSLWPQRLCPLRPVHLVPPQRHASCHGARAEDERRQQQLYSDVKLWSERTQEELLTPLNAKLLGPLERRAFSEAVPLPYVLLLGNHSSGKSSFINYLVGRPVQATGVAPTDDGFTVISPGASDADRDGASFIGDPAMGFSPLRAFGPALTSHFKVKVRGGLATSKSHTFFSHLSYPMLAIHHTRFFFLQVISCSLTHPG